MGLWSMGVLLSQTFGVKVIMVDLLASTYTVLRCSAARLRDSSDIARDV